MSLRYMMVQRCQFCNNWATFLDIATLLILGNISRVLVVLFSKLIRLKHVFFVQLNVCKFGIITSTINPRKSFIVTHSGLFKYSKIVRELHHVDTCYVKPINWKNLFVIELWFSKFELKNFVYISHIKGPFTFTSALFSPIH